MPDDTRPPAGRLDVTTSPDEALAPGSAGIETADGWHITFDRFLITLGEVTLEGDDCSVYNEVDYLRLLSLGANDTQKLSTPYARGACEFGFRMRPPTSETVLGEGVTATDYAFVGVPASDRGRAKQHRAHQTARPTTHAGQQGKVRSGVSMHRRAIGGLRRCRVGRRQVGGLLLLVEVTALYFRRRSGADAPSGKVYLAERTCPSFFLLLGRAGVDVELGRTLPPRCLITI